jgi:hypothetical protein
VIVAVPFVQGKWLTAFFTKGLESRGEKDNADVPKDRADVREDRSKDRSYR